MISYNMHKREFNYINGGLSMECYYDDNYNYHDILGKAAITRYREDGHVYMIEHYKHGKLHHDYKPSIIKFDKNVDVVKEEYYMDGISYTHEDRDASKYTYKKGIIRTKAVLVDGEFPIIEEPVMFSYYKNGNIKTEYFHKHSKNGRFPCIKIYHKSGRLKEETYCIDEIVSRAGDRPSIIKYFDNDESSIKKIFYFDIFNVNFSKVSRYQGPAYIKYDEQGNVVKQEFYEEGELLEGKDLLLRMRKETINKIVKYVK